MKEFLEVCGEKDFGEIGEWMDILFDLCDIVPG